MEIDPPPDMGKEEFQSRIMAAFDSYDDTLPYDPLPDKSENPSDVNSNSFAFSLIRAGIGKENTFPSVPYVYPGSNETIATMISAANRINTMSENIKISRYSLRNIIIESLVEGEVIDLNQYRKLRNKEQEWYDLFDPEEKRQYQSTPQSISSRREQDKDWLDASDEEFEAHLQNIDSKNIIDIFSDEDLSEQKGAKAYPGTVGVGIDIPGKDSSSGEAGGECKALRSQMINAEAEYQNADEGPDKNAKQVAWEDLQHAHEKECGP